MGFKKINYKGHCNSNTELKEIYFWTITIYECQHFLKPDDNKMIVMNLSQLLV